MMAIFRRRCAIVGFDIILFWRSFETMRRTDCCIALAPSMRVRARVRSYEISCIECVAVPQQSTLRSVVWSPCRSASCR